MTGKYSGLAAPENAGDSSLLFPATPSSFFTGHAAIRAVFILSTFFNNQSPKL